MLTFVPTDDQLRRQQRLGARIKEARMAQRLTGEQLAALVTAELQGQETAGQTMVSYWEKGRSLPSAAKLRALEKILGFRRNELAAILDPERFTPPLDSDGGADSIAAAVEEARRAVEHLAALVEADRRSQSASPSRPPRSSVTPRSGKPT